jgi:hypothetical protein
LVWSVHPSRPRDSKAKSSRPQPIITTLSPKKETVATLPRIIQKFYATIIEVYYILLTRKNALFRLKIILSTAVLKL